MNPRNNNAKLKEWAERVVGETRLADLIAASLDLIAPSSDARVACEAKLVERIGIVARVASWRGAPRAGEVRKILRRLGKALATAVSEAEALQRAGYSRLAFEGEHEEFLARAKRARLVAQLNAEGMVIPAAGRSLRDPAAIEAARSAYWLLLDFGAAPTMTAGGSYFTLAGLLFEAGTGERDANMERACRSVFDLKGEWADDLYGPRLIIRG